MPARRTFAAVIAVAALAGGTTGSVMTSLTNPDHAAAQEVPPTPDKPVNPDNPKLLRGTDREALILQTVNRIDRQMRSVQNQLQTQISGLGRMMRTPSGRTQGLILETVERACSVGKHHQVITKVVRWAPASRVGGHHLDVSCESVGTARIVTRSITLVATG